MRRVEISPLWIAATASGCTHLAHCAFVLREAVLNTRCFLVGCCEVAGGLSEKGMR
jgi:hypothetical protein